MKKLTAADIQYKAILVMDIPNQDGLLQGVADADEKVKNSRRDYKETTKLFGKAACAAEVRLNNGKAARVIAPNKSLAEFIEDIIGMKPPTHAMTLKNAFGGFVLTELITEKDYDVCSSNCLELGARIITAVKGDIAHDAVKSAAEQLRERGENAAKILRGILASLKPVKKMTAKEALEAFAEIVHSGHLGACHAQLPDELASMTSGDRKEIYISLSHAIFRMDAKFGAETNTWAEEAGNTWKPVDKGVEVQAAGVPVAPETANAAPEPETTDKVEETELVEA